MSWKFVFNSNLYAFAGLDLSDVLAFVTTTGYQFFTFNGNVYHTSGKYTGITTDELF